METPLTDATASLIGTIERCAKLVIDSAELRMRGKPFDEVTIAKRRIRYAEAHLFEMLSILKSAAGVGQPIRNAALLPLYEEMMTSFKFVKDRIDAARISVGEHAVPLQSIDEASEALFHARIACRHIILHLDRALDAANGVAVVTPDGAAVPSVSTAG